MLALLWGLSLGARQARLICSCASSRSGEWEEQQAGLARLQLPASPAAGAEMGVVTGAAAGAAAASKKRKPRI